MRITKTQSEDLKFFKKLILFYDKRSKLFHYGKDDFNKEELKELEELACVAICTYLKNPGSFSNEILNKLLLS